MPLCHRRRSNSAGINYRHYPFLILLLLLPAIIDGALPSSSSRRHAVVGTNVRRKHFRTIWQRRRVGGIPPSFVPRVSRGGGPAAVVVLSVASDADETNGVENNVTTTRRTSTTDITATPPTPLPLHNDTTYGDVRDESEEEDGIVASAAVATNDGDVSDDIDIAVTPTAKITIAAAAVAAAEIQYVTKKDGTMELFNKEKVR